MKQSFEAELAAMGIEPADVPKPPVREVAKPPHAHWERCKPWIAAGLGDGLLKIDDIEKALATGEAMLWPGEKSAIVSEFVTYPSGERASQVMSAGGDLDEILHMVPGMEAFARLNGCSTSVVEGRKGWQKVLAAAGYEFLAIKLRKQL